MEEITIVKRRSRLFPLLLLLIVIALAVAAALWFMSQQRVDEFGMNRLFDALRPAVLAAHGLI